MSAIFKIICEYVNSSNKPVDFLDIQNHVISLNYSPNKTTVYRILEKLQKDNNIQKVILSDQKQYWEKIDLESTNHAHLVCTNCNSIECQDILIPANISVTKFEVQRYQFNLFGLCGHCQS